MKIKIQSKDMMKMLGSKPTSLMKRPEILKADPLRAFLIHNFCES